MEMCTTGSQSDGTGGLRMSEYVKIKRRLYDELIEVKAKYIVLCQMLENLKSVYEQNKPEEQDGE